MEKLQAAIAKARAERGTMPGDPSPLRRQGAGRPDAAALWQALPALDPDPRRLARGRLQAFAGGPAAMPHDMLRTKIVQQMAAKGWTRLAITSPGPACGKTTTAANLAGSLSRQAELRTVLLDMDLRRPALARLFGHKPKHGLADLVEGRVAFADLAVRIRASVAVAMNPGPVRESAALLLAERTGAALDRLQRDYAADLMIFDLPPVFAGDDAAAILPRVDCALILAAAETTTIAQIDACERELAEQTNVLGVVLNKARFQDETYGRYDY